MWHSDKCFQVLFQFQAERQEGKMTVMVCILASSEKEQNMLKFTMMMII